MASSTMYAIMLIRELRLAGAGGWRQNRRRPRFTNADGGTMESGRRVEFRIDHVCRSQAHVIAVISLLRHQRRPCIYAHVASGYQPRALSFKSTWR